MVKEISYNALIRKQYPSDITREQFEEILPLLESGRKKTAPRKVDLYEVFCAVLYLLKSGCHFGKEVTVQVVKRNELYIFEVIPKRWIVERSFVKKCERKYNTDFYIAAV